MIRWPHLFALLSLFAPAIWAQSPPSDLKCFNRACERYRAQEFEAAEKEFAALAARTERPKLRAKALYNRGTALLAGTADGSVSNRVEAVSTAIDLFEQALELEPADLDCKQNLERALRIMVNGHIARAAHLLDEADALLQKEQAKAAQKNCETAQQALAPIREDFAPAHPEAATLLDRASNMLQRLEAAVNRARDDLNNAQHAIDLHEYQAADEVLRADSAERRWALDLDSDLAQKFQQLSQNNQHIIQIIQPQTNR